MKKFIAIAAILMLVPFTAFGLDVLSDETMGDVTGQAGVSISIDNVQLDFQMDYFSWGDADGFEATTGKAALDGFVNVSGITVKGIVIDKMAVGNSGLPTIATTPYLVTGTTTTAMDFSYSATAPDLTGDLQALTIDVGQNAGVDRDGNFGTYTMVRIGIPTLTIFVNEIDPFAIRLDTTYGTGGNELGSIALGGMQIDLKGGDVYIYAH